MDKTLFSIHFEVKKSSVVALVCMGIGYAIGRLKKSKKKTKKNDNIEKEEENN